MLGSFACEEEEGKVFGCRKCFYKIYWLYSTNKWVDTRSLSYLQLCTLDIKRRGRGAMPGFGAGETKRKYKMHSVLLKSKIIGCGHRGNLA